MSSKQVLPLLFGMLLGLTLSTILFYPNKISGAIFSERIKTNINNSIRQRQTSLYNQSLADGLYKSVRILCWVVTTPDNHRTKAAHIKSTWGRRCNKLLFMSSREDLDLGTVPLAVTEGRATLWDKTRSALQYIFNYHAHEADWFLKADDDSYFLIENLRYVLAQYSPATSLYLGHRFASKYVDAGYMAGGGYVLSKKALEKFVTRLMHDKDTCKIDNFGAEDLELGNCLQNWTLYADTRDELLQQILPEEQVATSSISRERDSETPQEFLILFSHSTTTTCTTRRKNVCNSRSLAIFNRQFVFERARTRSRKSQTFTRSHLFKLKLNCERSAHF